MEGSPQFKNILVNTMLCTPKNDMWSLKKNEFLGLLCLMCKKEVENIHWNFCEMSC
jgi:hypothetical protein